MTTDAARKAVFNMSELLESILVCLPPKTLFGVQRVSKQFQAVIATSIPIQEKMFLRLRNKPQRSWLLKIDLTELQVSGKCAFYFVESNALPPLAHSITPVEMNPLLELQGDSDRCADRLSATYECAQLDFDQPVSLAVLKYQMPSILDTCMSDPTPRDIKISFRYRFSNGNISIFGFMTKEEAGNGTIGDAINNALEGRGTIYTRPSAQLEEEAPQWERNSLGEVVHPRSVLEHYEQMFSSDTGFRCGIRTVEVHMFGTVVSTDTERAAVETESRGVEE